MAHSKTETFTDCRRRLCQLLEKCARHLKTYAKARETNHRGRTYIQALRANDTLGRAFPPDDNIGPLSDALYGDKLSFAAKELVLQILFIIADDEAFQALAKFIADRSQPVWLRTNAAMFCMQLNPRAAEMAIAASMPQLLYLARAERCNRSYYQATVDDPDDPLYVFFQLKTRALDFIGRIRKALEPTL